MECEAWVYERQSDFAILGVREVSTWAEAQSKLEQEQIRAEKRIYADKLAAVVDLLPLGADLPQDLIEQIGALNSSEEPPAELFQRLAERLSQAGETANLRSRVNDAVSELKARATQIGAYEYLPRGEILLRRVSGLAGDSDWDARRSVEQELQRLERDLDSRVAEAVAFQARLVALTAIYDAFQKQGFKLSTRELEMWTPQDGELLHHAYPLQPDEVLIRVPGSRKAVRLRASNEPDRPTSVSLRVDQVWLGDSTELSASDPASHARVCEAINEAMELLPGYGIDPLGLPEIEAATGEAQLPVIGLGAELEALLAEEEQLLSRVPVDTTGRNDNVRYADEPGQ
jgi:hypothetical protein